MTFPRQHSWNVSAVEAMGIQNRLRESVLILPLKDRIQLVAGADVSFDKGSDLVYAAVVVLRFPQLDIVEISGVSERVDFPYIPGLLAFREGPPVLHAWEKLQAEPDAILFDAQGLAHPRRLGLASHLGVILDIPSVGCAKSVLVGKYEEPGMKAGDHTDLLDGHDTVGVALRTKDGVSPVFVSVGHLIDLPAAINLVLRCTKRYRIPEPTRQAHIAVNALRRGETIDTRKTSIQESLF